MKVLKIIDYNITSISVDTLFIDKQKDNAFFGFFLKNENRFELKRVITNGDFMPSKCLSLYLEAEKVVDITAKRGNIYILYIGNGLLKARIIYNFECETSESDFDSDFKPPSPSLEEEPKGVKNLDLG